MLRWWYLYLQLGELADVAGEDGRLGSLRLVRMKEEVPPLKVLVHGGLVCCQVLVEYRVVVLVEHHLLLLDSCQGMFDDQQHLYC